MTREEAISKWIYPAIATMWNENRVKEILEALEPYEDCMTNQEYIATLPPAEFWAKIHWLQKDFGKRYNDSEQAIIGWLSAEREE